ncbi:NAD(P)H-dependent oxidoreductase [Novosphingobium percolationis]|uniref:NAD(P)H-dependent oxidoreductase n=1 Tax=Novosphingobium percolationis TaxID=2871811 RepID=UPI001CD7FB06|nr:NAD(P)H-dependent oxidoreductase [Novosphingobium percolationis]
MQRRALLVHAHSEPDSFVTAMRDRIAVSLAEAGYELLHSDLYQMNWNPVLSPQDFGTRRDESHLTYALEQRHNYEMGTLSSDVLEEIEKVRSADLVVFTFPLFWFNVPAILKGWIDRVFVSGLFYGGKAIYGRAGLVGKQATAAFSLGGREYMFGPEGLHGPLVDGFLRSFFQGSLGYVGFEVIEPFGAYHAPYLPQEERQACLDQLAGRFLALDTQPRIPLPDLTQFGDRFEKLAAVRDMPID